MPHGILPSNLSSCLQLLHSGPGPAAAAGPGTQGKLEPIPGPTLAALRLRTKPGGGLREIQVPGPSAAETV